MGRLVSVLTLVFVPLIGCATQEECADLADCQAGFVCSSTGACVADPIAAQTDPWGRPWSAPAPALVAGDVRGDVGPVVAIAGAASATATDFGSYELYATFENGTGMGFVRLSFDRPEQLFAHVDQGPIIDLPGAYTQVCSDSADGALHYDATGVDAVLTVSTRGDRATGEPIDVDVDADIDADLEAPGGVVDVVMAMASQGSAPGDATDVVATFTFAAAAAAAAE